MLKVFSGTVVGKSVTFSRGVSAVVQPWRVGGGRELHL